MEEQTNKILCLEDFLLNNRAKIILRNMAEKSSYPNSFLIEGAKGTGRRSFAYLLLSAMLCHEKIPCAISGNEPCKSCGKILRRVHPDVFDFLGDSSKDYAIDNIRKISSSLTLRVPSEADRNAFIFPNAELMSEKSQNALLKSIEEPPNNAVFIFTAENRRSLLPTILSRTMVITLDTPTQEDTLSYLLRQRERGFLSEFSEEELRASAVISKAGFGSALEILNSKEKRELYDDALELANLLEKGEDYGSLKKLEEIIANKKELSQVLRLTKEIFEGRLFLLAQRKEESKSPIKKQRFYLNAISSILEARKKLDSNCGGAIASAELICTLF